MTVIVLAPSARAIFEIVHAAADPLAVPDTATEEDAVDQVTVIVPEPPDAEPVSVTAEAVVVAAAGATVRLSAAGVGVGKGEGDEATVPGCAVYNV